MGRRYTQEEWIEKARQVHGDKYDYSKVEYKGNNKDVVIVCPEHGEFKQTPNNHVNNKQNCPICGELKRREKRANGIEHFLFQCSKIYGDKYDYSRITEYKNNKQEIEIGCPIHGFFKRRIFDHIIAKLECPICQKLESRGKVFGVGKDDIYNSHNTWQRKYWEYMLHRCYYENDKKPTYKDVYVCDEWLTFSNFKKWADDPNNGYREGYHLDKDILVKRNKVYSPETCCFVPERINLILIKRQNDRGEFPIGITKYKNKFRASICKHNNVCRLGDFATPEEAFLAYKDAKESYIKEVAQEYYERGEITKKVFDALMRYEVEITD